MISMISVLCESGSQIWINKEFEWMMCISSWILNLPQMYVICISYVWPWITLNPTTQISYPWKTLGMSLCPGDAVFWNPRRLKLKEPIEAMVDFEKNMSWKSKHNFYHGENGGTLGMVPLIINPKNTLYSGYLLGIPPSKGLLGGLKQLVYHPRVPAFSLWF